MNNVLLDHLSYLSEVNFSTVPEFADFCGTPNARAVLDSYIAAGYVRRDWRQNRGMYSITESGRSQLAKLVAKSQESKKNAKPDSSKQPSSKSDTGRSGGSGANQSNERTAADSAGPK
jgi:hypothetical protein